MAGKARVVMGRAKRGIFAGRHIQFGNRVSEDGGNKTRRTWKPNVQKKRLYSLILGDHIRVNITTHALRCIDKAGGIDEYLMNTPDRKLDNERCLQWKKTITDAYKNMGKIRLFGYNKLLAASKKPVEGIDKKGKISVFQEEKAAKVGEEKTVSTEELDLLRDLWQKRMSMKDKEKEKDDD